VDHCNSHQDHYPQAFTVEEARLGFTLTGLKITQQVYRNLLSYRTIVERSIEGINMFLLRLFQ